MDISPAFVCSQLVRSYNRKCMPLTCQNPSDYTFVQLADPQLGMMERFIENREPPIHWDREVAMVNQAVKIVNNLVPKPEFVMVCGDLAHGRPDNPDQIKQYADLMKTLASLRKDIPLLVLPGNHDLGNEPSSSTIKGYCYVFGEDYYSFWCGPCKYIVVNSQLYWNSSKCSAEATAQDEWLTNELSALENQNAEQLIVFQHIPFFRKNIYEDDGYYNLPKSCRFNLLQRYYEAGVRFVFSGHLHYNGGGVWYPEGCSSFPLQLVSSSSVCVQMGEDKSGLRIVRVSNSSKTISHKYFALNELV